MDKTVKIPLDFPIELDGATVGELTLRRPTVKDTLIAEKQGKGNSAGAEVTLVANLTGISTAAVESLDFGDFIKIQEAIKGFLPSKSSETT